MAGKKKRTAEPAAATLRQRQSLATPLDATPGGVSVRHLVAAVAGAWAAWTAAGALGMLAPPLTRAVCWLLLGTALAAAWPTRWSWRNAATLSLAAAAATAMLAARQPVVNVMAAAVMLAGLAAVTQAAGARRALLTAALGTAAVGWFELARQGIPAIWLAVSAACRPLGVGSSLAGVDLLVLMAVVYGLWLAAKPAPRRRSAIVAAAAILLVQLAYWLLLTSYDWLLAQLAYWLQLIRCDWLLARLTEIAPPAGDLSMSRVGSWTWGAAMRSLIPWNLPVLAAAMQSVVLAAILRAGSADDSEEQRPTKSDRSALAFGISSALLAALLPTLLLWGPRPTVLDHRKIVVCDRGVDWSKPEPRRPAASDKKTFGMLPQLLEGFGGRLIPAADLSPEVLADADAVLALPGTAWPVEQVERVWAFVRRGGSLLIAGVDHDELLAETGDPPARRPGGRKPRRRSVGRSNDASSAVRPPAWARRVRAPSPAALALAWPARPLAVERWARGVPGGEAALAAEQRVGDGRVIVLADASCLDSDGCVAGYPVAARLLAYLCDAAAATPAWRTWAALATAIALAGLLLWRPNPLGTVAAVLSTVGSLVFCALGVETLPPILPEGAVCIDASHLEAYSRDPRAEDGLGTLARVLMQKGYLPLMVPELAGERLARAAALISIAPAREFSETDRKMLRDYVDSGGMLICTVGAEQARPSQAMLGDFDLAMRPTPFDSPDAQDVEPLGRLRQPYDGAPNRRQYVDFYAAWPIERSVNTQSLVERSDPPGQRTVAAVSYRGDGCMLLIGDTCFAMNKNFAGSDGRPSDNAAFWHWLLDQQWAAQRQPGGKP